MISPTARSGTAADPISEIRRVFDICVEKTRRNIAALDGKTWAFDKDGDYDRWNEGFFEIGNWTSSFFTGMALIAWKDAEDEHFIRETERLAPQFHDKVFVQHTESMHDLGFLYLLYSVALYKLTGKKDHREVGLRAAQVLADRFIPEGGYIRAWGRMDEPDTDYAGLAIIDCMMNLPLLFWATEETGDPKFREIAIRHSDTTLAHFIREDDSVYHSFRFDKSGAPVGGDNYCGSDVESHWARGTTWAMYGFAMSYRYTGDERYLDASLRVAEEFVRNLDEEIVPMWDFRIGEGRLAIRDSSAGAIAICAVQELEVLGRATEKLKEMKTAMLARLCSPDYFDPTLTTRGILKFAEVGDGVGYARSAYTSWGDYYFMEALARELGQKLIWC